MSDIINLNRHANDSVKKKKKKKKNIGMINRKNGT